MSAANMQAVIELQKRRNAQPLSPEMRAQIVADSMGMLPHDERKKVVYATALQQIRAAVAVAVAQATEGFGPAVAGD